MKTKVPGALKCIMQPLTSATISQKQIPKISSNFYFSYLTLAKSMPQTEFLTPAPKGPILLQCSLSQGIVPSSATNSSQRVRDSTVILESCFPFSTHI